MFFLHVFSHWDCTETQERKRLLESNGFTWSVVESVPVHESIKLGKAEREKYIQVTEQTEEPGDTERAEETEEKNTGLGGGPKQVKG